MDLIWLNKLNGASEVQLKYAEICEREFEGTLTYVEMGLAYGGGVQAIGRMPRWEVYGFDTFEGHPKHLSYDIHSFEAVCMDYWYNNPEYGKEALKLEYQQKVLDEEGLKNVHLIKGEVQQDSCKDIDKIHLALLDMDMIAPTRTGFIAVNDKIVKGGYLMMHDALPKYHLPKIHKFVYEEVVGHGWVVVEERPSSYISVLKRI